MGQDKAKLRVDGEPLAQRIARLLTEAGITVTVLGREQLPGYLFLADVEEFSGPLVALSRFIPSADFVFVCSCDLPGLAPALVAELRGAIGEHEAAIPVVRGRMQPLCGIYRSHALRKAAGLAATGEKRIMRWVESLDALQVQPSDELWAKNVNSPADWPNVCQPNSTSDSAS